MRIILVDGDNAETYDSLEQAAAAAKARYSYLEKDGFKLPPWEYPIHNIPDLTAAINDYKARLCAALGRRDEIAAGPRLRAKKRATGFGAGDKLSSRDYCCNPRLGSSSPCGVAPRLARPLSPVAGTSSAI